MRNKSVLLSLLAMALSIPCFAARTDAGEYWTPRHDLTAEIPAISKDVTGKKLSNATFQKVADVAQYKNADWSKVVGIVRGITVDEALAIAKSNPQITYFVHTKGYQMVLEKTDGNYRSFRNGDTVFFSGTPHFGTAPGLADAYVKQ